MRTQVISGNWKMNTEKKQAEALSSEIAKHNTRTDVKIILFPPAIHIEAVQQHIQASPVELGIQNIYSEESGAYTGELSAQMCADYHCNHVLIGHSERRVLFNETNQLLNKKIHTALNHHLQVTYCVGETNSEREENKTFQVIATQLEEGFKELSEKQASQLIIAYEPVWAIGTGKVASPEQAQEVHAFIRKTVSNRFNASIATTIPIQYGGSVKPENTRDLLSQPDIDGALVGGASLKSVSFNAIIQAASERQLQNV